MNEKTKKKLLGLAIRKERKRYKLTQERLGSMIGIDAKNISNIERGISFPKVKTLCDIIEVLNVEPNILLDFIPVKKLSNKTIDICIYEKILSFSPDIKNKINELLQAIQAK